MSGPMDSVEVTVTPALLAWLDSHEGVGVASAVAAGMDRYAWYRLVGGRVSSVKGRNAVALAKLVGCSVTDLNRIALGVEQLRDGKLERFEQLLEAILEELRQFRASVESRRPPPPPPHVCTRDLPGGHPAPR